MDPFVHRLESYLAEMVNKCIIPTNFMLSFNCTCSLFLRFLSKFAQDLILKSPFDSRIHSKVFLIFNCLQVRKEAVQASEKLGIFFPESNSKTVYF